VSACEGCGASLVWAVSGYDYCDETAGKRSPIVAAPDAEKGNVLLLAPSGLASPLAVVLSGELLQEARAANVPLHLNHFADCPKREAFRR
jgi:hypothetical protein